MNTKQVTETVGLMMRVLRMHRCRCEHKLTGFSLHHSQHRMIMYLHRMGQGLSQNQLAAHFKISAAATSGTVRKLEKGGYIKCRPDKADLRTNIITLTDKGKKVAESSKEIFESIDINMTDGIDDESLKVFRACLEKMIDNLEGSKQ